MKDKDSRLIFEAWQDRARKAGKEFGKSGGKMFENPEKRSPGMTNNNYLKDVLGYEPEDMVADDPDQSAMDREDRHGPSQGHAFQEYQYMVVSTLGADEPLQDGDRSLGRSAYDHVRQLASELQGIKNIASKRDKIESWAKKIVETGGAGPKMPFTDDQKIKLNKFLERFLTKVHMIADTNGDDAVDSEMWNFRAAVEDLEDMSADERYNIVNDYHRLEREDDKDEYEWESEEEEFARDDDPNPWA